MVHEELILTKLVSEKGISPKKIKLKQGFCPCFFLINLCIINSLYIANKLF